MNQTNVPVNKIKDPEIRRPMEKGATTTGKFLKVI